MTGEEIRIVIAAIALLQEGTSNSLDPVHRQSWREDRDFILAELEGMLR